MGASLQLRNTGSMWHLHAGLKASSGLLQVPSRAMASPLLLQWISDHRCTAHVQAVGLYVLKNGLGLQPPLKLLSGPCNQLMLFLHVAASHTVMTLPAGRDLTEGMALLTCQLHLCLRRVHNHQLTRSICVSKAKPLSRDRLVTGSVMPAVKATCQQKRRAPWQVETAHQQCCIEDRAHT